LFGLTFLKETLPMEFALLGEDAVATSLVRAIADCAEHGIVRGEAEWEQLLVDDAVDAVIVAGCEADVLDGAKQLAAAGVPLLVVPHIGQGAGWVYELTLARDDSGVVLMPGFPDVDDPALTTLGGLLAEAALGELLYIQVERTCDRTDVPAGRLFEVREIDEFLLPDVAVLLHLFGDYSRVTALRSGVIDGRVAAVSVTLAGTRLPEVSWSLQAASGESGWKMTVTGEQGVAILSRGDQHAGMNLDVRGERIVSGKTDNFLMDCAGAAIERFSLKMAGEAVRPDWSDLTRTFEIVEATHRSVRRRRSIDIYFETQSERSQFKTQMTAIGCGVLCLTLVAVIVLLMIGALFDVPPVVMHIGRVLVFLPVFVFLGLQLLVFIAKPTSRDSGTSAATDDESRSDLSENV
jgi:predicted dehydrogenase